MYQEDKLTQQSVWAAHGRPDAATSIHTPSVQKGIDMKAPSNGKVVHMWALVCKDARRTWETDIIWVWEMEEVMKSSRVEVQYW